MNWRMSTASGAGRVLTVVGLIGALLATSGSRLRAGSDDSDNRGKLVGAWFVQVTLRDCATNAPLGPPFNSLVSFHRGGTISESAGSLAFAPNQRSAGHGAWTRHGQSGHVFDQRMVALILFDTAANLPGTPGFNPALPITPGFFAGWQEITQVVRLDGDSLTSAGNNEFYTSNGELYRTGCSTAIAKRFE